MIQPKNLLSTLFIDESDSGTELNFMSTYLVVNNRLLMKVLRRFSKFRVGITFISTTVYAILNDVVPFLWSD